MSLIYVKAARAVYDVLKGHKSAKAAVYDQFKGQGIKKEIPAILALTSATCKDYSTLRDFLIRTKLVSASDLPHNTHDLSTFKTRVFQLLAMSCDHLNGKRIRCSGSLKRELSQHLDKLEKRVSCANEVSVLPRYLRVDLARWSREDALEYLKSVNMTECVADDIVPSVIVCPPRTHDAKLRQLDVVKDGRLVMMDRATCLSPYAADLHPEGDVVIDVCAAPGSKSLAYLSMMSKTGILVSIEKDATRFLVLAKRLQSESRLTHCYAVNLFTFKKSLICLSDEKSLLQMAKTNFLFFEHPSYPHVKAAAILADFIETIYCCQSSRITQCQCNRGDGGVCLNRLVGWLASDSIVVPDKCVISLDPSCSGSGLVEHQDDFSDPTKHQAMSKRITHLTTFQSILLKKAMSFSTCRAILYSTCSIFYEENEKVVLESLTDDKWCIPASTLPETIPWKSDSIVAHNQQDAQLPNKSGFVRATRSE